MKQPTPRLFLWSRAALGSPLLVPILFLAFHHEILGGSFGFSHDAGDGIAAFKFFSFPPPYWNWFENTGQPFWMDMGWFRVQDPLFWPLLALVKLLPTDTLTAYGIFLLARVALVGFGFGLLLREMGVSPLARQWAAFMALFGSLGAIPFRQVGMLDLGFCFIYSALFGLRFLRRGEALSLWALTLVLVSGTLSYHILLLWPVACLALVLFLLNWRSTAQWRAHLCRHGRSVGAAGLITLLSLGASYAATKHPGLLPLLRNLRYHSEVSADGVNLSRGPDHGKSILSEDGLFERRVCRVDRFCSQYPSGFLRNFLSPKQAPTELATFVSLTGLFLAAAGLLFIFRAPVLCVAVFTAFTYFLSLGSRSFAWPAFQSAFPFLTPMRHTHFYLCLFTFGIIALAALAATELAKMMPVAGRRSVFWVSVVAALTVGIVVDCLDFQRLTGLSLRHRLPPRLHARIERRGKDPSFWHRKLRLNFPELIPRSGVGTVEGVPTALESASGVADDTAGIRHFGSVTPFYLREYVEARLFFSNDPPSLRRAFGVHPYPALAFVSPSSVAPLPQSPELVWIGMGSNQILVDPFDWEKLTGGAPASPDAAVPNGAALRIEGDRIEASNEWAQPLVAYAALPFGQIARVLVDNVAVPFFRANRFGLAFSLPPGKHAITFLPNVTTKLMVFSGFYGSYGLALIWLALLLRARQPQNSTRS